MLPKHVLVQDQSLALDQWANDWSPVILMGSLASHRMCHDSYPGQEMVAQDHLPYLHEKLYELEVVGINSKWGP